jgi:hypothetical protein
VDGNRFDALARALAAPGTRRRLLAGLAAAALGPVGRRGAEAVACRMPGELCREHADCCSKLCATGADGRLVCQCPAPTVACGRSCADPAIAFQSDPKNCGGCGTRCPRTRCQVATCTQGSCGLAPDPAAVGLRCDDGNPCTTGDACTARGTCTGTEVNCGRLDGPCAQGVCNPRTGGCEAQSINEGQACNDGNACTQTDTCQRGTCVGSNPVACPPPGQCQTGSGTCDPATGQCVYASKLDGTPCDDGDRCTQTDTCQGGACVGGDPVACAAGEICRNGGCFVPCQTVLDCPFETCPGCACIFTLSQGLLCLDTVTAVGECASAADCPAGTVCSTFFSGNPAKPRLCTQPCCG